METGMLVRAANMVIEWQPRTVTNVLAASIPLLELTLTVLFSGELKLASERYHYWSRFEGTCSPTPP